MKTTVLVCALVVGCGGVTVDERPLGEWVAPADSLGFEHRVLIGESVICGPSSKCEQILSWEPGLLVTEDGSYRWSLQGGALSVCGEPCGEGWSALVQADGWATWGRK